MSLPGRLVQVKEGLFRPPALIRKDERSANCYLECDCDIMRISVEGSLKRVSDTDVKFLPTKNVFIFIFLAMRAIVPAVSVFWVEKPAI